MAIKLPETFYFHAGEKAVLLLHAYSGSPNDVRMLGRSLEGKGYSVYAPLFSGHGTLDPEDIFNYTPDDWWLDTCRGLQFLKDQGHKEIAVFGLSMGGIFALRLLEAEDPMLINGGAFCSPIVPDPQTNVVPNFLLYTENVLKLQRLDKTEIEQRLIHIKPRVEAQLLQIQKVSSMTYRDLTKVQVPVFLAQAGKDEMIEAEDVYRTKKKITGNLAEVFWYPNGTHVITVGTERKALENDLAEFLLRHF